MHLLNDKRLTVIVLTLLICCCGGESYRSAITSDRPALSNSRLTQSVEVPPYIPDQFGNAIGEFITTYSNEERLLYLDYEITKLTRTALNASKEGQTQIEYAVLRRNGRVVARFDSAPDRLSEIRFGLFSFLGGAEKQLVIEQTSDKFWRYWVVSLEPTFKIIYDSDSYNLVYELRVADLDQDGTLEIVQNLGSFWYFESLDNLYSPRPPIVFAYDSTKRVYSPATRRFEQVTLNDIAERVAKTTQVIERADDRARQLHVRSAVLDIVIRYLYSGKSVDAWAFYDRHYNIEDKAPLKSKILKKLGSDKLFRSIEADPQ